MSLLVTQNDFDYLTEALGHAPTDFEQKLYLRLEQYLNRQPNPTECLNMKTDTNLVMWVLSNQ